MSKFYTQTGDEGYTNLLGKGRVAKHAPRLEAIGTIDEANAALGMARASCQAAQTGSILLTIQHDLYKLMAEVSATPENAARFQSISNAQVSWLEEQIESLSQSVPAVQEFIVPGDSLAGATLALARTVVRRAERRITQLVHTGELHNQATLHYLNRLSSLCFVLELLETQHTGKESPTLAKDGHPRASSFSTKSES